MQEKDRPGRADIEATKSGDYTSDEFVDWDNPEDFEDEDWEDAPEGYYDDDGGTIEFEDGSYVPGPEDPDYDLSEAAGYSGWEEPGSREIIPQWVIIAVSMILILSFVGALFIRLS
jgi:hypothetical protein